MKLQEAAKVKGQKRRVADRSEKPQYTDEEDWLALNLYRRYFVAEKETGKVHVKKNDSDGVMFNYKSLHLSEEEYLNLMYQTGD